MKSIITATVSLFFLFMTVSAQNNKAQLIRYDGMYIAKTGHVDAANADIYTYLRFYKDGTVCLQAISSYDPQPVSFWFGRFKRFSQKGTYKFENTSISIQTDNKESEDFKLEGLEETRFKGAMKSPTELCMKRNEETKEYCFLFASVKDTTTIKYSKLQAEIRLPGEWRLKQVLQKSRQVFFINEDSAIVAIAVHKTSDSPVFNEAHSSFEATFAYYKWDSDFMRDEEKMEVSKIAENRAKSFITWNAKDKNNDNYYLFGEHNGKLFNIMVYDRAMTPEKQAALLEILYDVNKE